MRDAHRKTAAKYGVSSSHMFIRKTKGSDRRDLPANKRKRVLGWLTKLHWNVAGDALQEDDVERLVLVTRQ